MQETWVRSLGWEDPLEKGMAFHSQKSCLGNPMDRGAWLAMVCGVTKSWTQLSGGTTTTPNYVSNPVLAFVELWKH